MHFSDSQVFQWLAQYAYEPMMVYFFVFGMMVASGFGLPIPEEVQIISVGVLAYMGAHPELFPPPYVGAPVINGYEAAAIVFAAVVFSDNLVFWIGRTFGRKMMNTNRLKGFFEKPMMTKVQHFASKYGVYAAFIFRFTPGLRFPAHIFLGMSRFSATSFFLVDGFAALLSVPTQVLLVYHFGEPILATLYKLKTYVGIALAIALLYYVGHRLFLRCRKVRTTKGA